MLRIGIVAPSSYPFMVGGAEKLWWGLLDHINHATPHVADLVKIPSPESDLRSLVRSYRDFARLDMSGFDVVISSKYPAWMVSHPRHVCYMQHRLRGLYDTYNAAAFGTAPSLQDPGVATLVKYMREHVADRTALPAFFDAFEQLAASPATADALAFPGPLARQIVHFLDGTALQVGSISRFAAISRNVARRAGYFPAGVDPAVVHHPSDLTGFRCEGFDYLFTAGRLDGPKRMALLVEAMRHVKSDIRLRIAGTGPDADRLHEMARGDQRIEFLGFVRDEELVDYYAHALAVPYIPMDEDYGLITTEAMACGKPVITCSDSGGTLELVTDGVTGRVVAPRAEDLGRAIDALAGDPDRARAMGAEGRKRASAITWRATLETLLAGSEGRGGRRAARARRRITVSNAFHVTPPRGGGQSRIVNLYGQLARNHDIEVVVFAEPGAEAKRHEIRPGLTEIQVPPSPEHLEAERKLREETGYLQIGDVALFEVAHLTPDYGAALRASGARADFVFASHPYTYPALSEALPGKPLGHDSHNVEYVLKRGMLPGNAASQRLVEKLRAAEGACCSEARFILSCAADDRAGLISLYGVPDAKFVDAPNGVDTREIAFVPIERRRALREKLGLTADKLVLFMGSWHGPNVEARDRVLAVAPKCPGVAFVLIGSACMAPLANPVPPNVRMLGVVEEELRKALFATADVALNPMASGSGTNLKMLDYLSAGLPVVTTAFGARGLGLQAGVHMTVADEALEAGLMQSLALDDDARAAMVVAGRRHVERQYDWAIIADNIETAWRGMGLT